ncbi:hypothetical protein D3C75_795850 [compost metagenome]
MPLLTSILLGYLKLDYLIGALHRSEQWRHWLPNLEIHRSVLDLQEYIIPELAIQRLKVIISRPRTIRRAVPPVLHAVIDKAAPNDKSAMRFKRIRQHICSIGMISSISKRSRTMLGIRFDHKTAKVGNMPINAVRRFNPPYLDLIIKRIGSIHSTNRDRSCKVDAQEQRNPIIPEHFCKTSHIRQQLFRNKLRFNLMYIHIINRNRINSHRSKQPRVVTNTRGILNDFSILIKYRVTSITTFDRAVSIIPLIDHTQSVQRAFFRHQFSNALPQGNATKQVKHPIQYACSRSSG